MSDLSGRVVLITGASAGIGRATALYLAQQGASVALVARRRERLDELVAEIEANTNGHALAIPCDISESDGVERVVAETVAHFGRLDVLLNNAGLGHRSTLTELTVSELERMLQINVVGLFGLARAAAHQMMMQEPFSQANGRRGHIINVSSIISVRPLLLSAGYSGSKAAVDHITRGMRMELRRKNIVLTSVYPGVTQTEFNQVRLGDAGESNFSPFAVSPERVAHKIGRVIKRPRRDVYITPIDWLFVHANRLFPNILDRVFANVRT